MEKISLQKLAHLINVAANKPLLNGAKDLSMYIGRTIIKKKDVLYKYKFVKTFYKKKSNGGYRMIVSYDNILGEKLKYLNKVLQDIFEATLPPFFCGCRSSISVVDTAKEFSSRMSYDSYIGHLDIVHWFDSIRYEHIEPILAQSFDGYALPVVTELCTHRGVLPQGNPCSPLLANLVGMKTWGKECHQYCEKNGIFARCYVDDISILASSKDDAWVHIHEIAKIVNKHGFETHKHSVAGHGQKQKILGVIINKECTEEVRAPKWLRRKIGAIKDKIKKGTPMEELVNTWAKINKKPLETIDDIISAQDGFKNWLQGQINWITQCNPKHGEKLK